MDRPSIVLASVAVAALLTAQVGCGSDSVSPGSQDPYVVEALTPTSFSATVGAVASPAPSVRVTDRHTHKPVAGVTIEFVAGGGSVANNNVVTDAAGIASPGEWVFGTRPGLSNLHVFLNGTHAVVFFAVTLRPDVPAQLVSITRKDQAALPSESVWGPAVLVRDRFDNPIAGVRVEFEVTVGGGKIEKSFTMSGLGGVAESGMWTLGLTPGLNLATARVSGFAPLEFSARVLDPATIKWYRLESVRWGSSESTPNSWGIDDARLGLTVYDACLCRKQEGYFIDRVTYINFGFVQANSGTYLLDGPKLTLSASFETSLEGGVIDGTILLLGRVDYDFGESTTWVYREIN